MFKNKKKIVLKQFVNQVGKTRSKAMQLVLIRRPICSIFRQKMPRRVVVLNATTERAEAK